MYTFSFMDTPFLSPLVLRPVSWRGAHWHANVEIPVSTMSSSVPWHGATWPLVLSLSPHPPGVRLCHNPINIPFTVTQSSRQMNLFSKSIKRELIKRNVSVFVFPNLSAKTKKMKKGNCGKSLFDQSRLWALFSVTWLLLNAAQCDKGLVSHCLV